MKIKGIKCLRCGDFIFSRSRHDFRWCSCKSCAVDGGFNYMSINGNRENWEIAEKDILREKTDDEVKKILYDDWNFGKNKYGLIKEK
jgi:hypothetical protein